MKRKLLTAAEVARLLENCPHDGALRERLEAEATILELIGALIGSPTPAMRVFLCDLLAARRAKSAFQPLLACLDDKDAEVRAHAAEALAYIGMVGAIPDLERALKREGEARTSIRMEASLARLRALRLA